MGYVLQETKAHVSRFFATPLNVLCVVIIAACGFVFIAFKPYDPSRVLTDWAAASESFRWATSVAVLFAFGWSSSAMADDRNSGVLEMLIPSGLPAHSYLTGKIVSALAVAIAPAVALFACLCLYRLFTAGAFDPIPYVFAMIALYLPPVMFATCLGFLAGLPSEMRMPEMIAFALFWSVCFMGTLFLPSSFQAFDITGNSLYEGFFVAPLDVTSVNASGMSASVLQQVASYNAERRFFQDFDLVFLLSASALCLMAALKWLHRCWLSDAAPLIANRAHEHSATLFEVPISLLELKVAKSWKILVVASLLILTTFLLGPSAGSSSSNAVFMLESATPLAASFLFAGTYAADRAHGVSETMLSFSRFWVPYVRRLLLVFVSMTAVLCVEAVQWNGVLGVGFPELLVVGLIPTIFMGAAAFVLGMTLGNEGATCAFLAGIWAAFQLPMVQQAFANLGICWLFPFPANASSIAVAPSWLYAVLAVLLAFAGFRLLGNPEKLSS